MNNRFIALSLCLASFVPLCKAQTTTTRVPFVIKKAGTVRMFDIKEDWNPVLQNIEAPRPDGNRNELQKIKDSLSILYPKKSHQKAEENTKPQGALNKSLLKTLAVVPAPFLGKNYEGNTFNGGTPNDNDIAISNDGKIVSVQNSTIFTCDANNYAASVRLVSIPGFATVLANPNSKFDPKTIYDPISDKFVIVFLNGFTDSTSSITVAFSTSNDPRGTWNLYELPGNPFNNGLWTDFPMIAMTEKELFITVNLLYPDSSWQTGFNETLIWQVNKNSGYTGAATLDAVVHNNIKFGGKPLRNLCPVKGGSRIYGPEMYFLSERNLDPQNDTVFLVKLNDTIGAAGFAINVTQLTSPISYFMPPNANQPGPGLQLLATNDSRILGAFIENDKIQYVQNCLDTATGHAAICHGIISNVSTTPTIDAKILADTLLEFGYPNLSYAGYSPTDHSATISFNHSALTVNPGISAMVSDGTGSYSPLTTIKTSTTYLSVLTGDERWGDYSGSQLKYNQPGRVWISGLYASPSRYNTTWMAELSPTSMASIAESASAAHSSISLYPNPTKDQMNVVLNLEKANHLSFAVYDLSGRLVKLLLQERVKAGKNNFSFSTTPLSAGSYFLKVHTATNEIMAQKFEKL